MIYIDRCLDYIFCWVDVLRLLNVATLVERVLNVDGMECKHVLFHAKQNATGEEHCIGKWMRKVLKRKETKVEKRNTKS